jgi:hypothetical protein
MAQGRRACSLKARLPVEQGRSVIAFTSGLAYACHAHRPARTHSFPFPVPPVSLSLSFPAWGWVPPRPSLLSGNDRPVKLDGLLETQQQRGRRDCREWDTHDKEEQPCAAALLGRGACAVRNGKTGGRGRGRGDRGQLRGAQWAGCTLC